MQITALRTYIQEHRCQQTTLEYFLVIYCLQDPAISALSYRLASQESLQIAYFLKDAFRTCL